MKGRMKEGSGVYSCLERWRGGRGERRREWKRMRQGGEERAGVVRMWRRGRELYECGGESEDN